MKTPGPISSQRVASAVSGWLLIGYGNELRGDDAAGPRVAHAVAAWREAGVQALAVHQLAPELAEPIARAASVLFVDACRRIARLRWRRLRPEHARPAALGHVSDPERLLAWAQTLYGRCPPAWLIAVPAHSLELGATPSSLTRGAIDDALQSIRRFIHATRRRTPPRSADSSRSL